MSTKDPPHPDSGNKPFPTTRRSLNPGPPSTSAQVTPLPPAPQGPPSSRRALPPTTITGPLRPPPSLPTVSAPPPLPRMHEGPPSSRAPSIPPPNSSPTTPIPSKSTLPASVRALHVRFLGEDGWTDSFDSLAAGALPRAVEVSIWFGAPVSDEAGASDAEASEPTPARAGGDEAAESLVDSLGPPDRQRVFAVPDAGSGAGS